MRIVLRFPKEGKEPGASPLRKLALLGFSLLSPAALLCFAVCLWRWSYELSWAAQFPVVDGVLSHWQSWFVAGGALLIFAVAMARYAETGQRPAPGPHMPADARRKKSTSEAV